MDMSLKTQLRPAAVGMYKSATLHHLYPGRYKKLAEKTCIKKGKAVFLEERETFLTDNFSAVYAAMEGLPFERIPVFTGNGGESPSNPAGRVKLETEALRELADAQFIFLNDSSSLVSCLPLREETKVIQLWHACGAFKKFGYSLADKKYGMNTQQLNRFPMHRNFSYVTVSSPEVIWAYEEAFDMKGGPGKVVSTGVARTDMFFDPARKRAARKKLEKAMEGRLSPQQISLRKIVLYAPTFRGNASSAVSPDVLRFDELHKVLGDDYLFLVKHHPFVRIPPKIPAGLESFAVDVSKQMAIEDLLMLSDVCISDYSSLIFEYSLTGRPMLFLAPDLDDYGDWRGFYYPYEEMSPGPVIKDTAQTAACLRMMEVEGVRRWQEEIGRFREKFMSSCDGRACERILQLLE